jgi:hypothetical protein
MKPLPKLVQIAPNLPAPPKTGGRSRYSKEWQSAGVRGKPETCGQCQFSQVGTAFVPDHMPPTAKICFVLPYPRQSDAMEQRPFSGAWGELMKKLLITDLGRRVEEVGLVNGIRCMPRKVTTRQGTGYEYPSGSLQRSAESCCRQYDSSSFKEGLLSPGGIIEFNPNLVLITLDLSSILEVGAFKFMVQRDVEKAWTFVDEGYRVAVLFGSEVLSLVAGHLKGGAKRWRGSWYESDGWPFESKIRKERGFR